MILGQRDVCLFIIAITLLLSDLSMIRISPLTGHPIEQLLRE